MALQRRRLMMFTSCGWFFDRPTGLETLQILRYADSAIRLTEELTGKPLTGSFLEDLTGLFQDEPSTNAMNDWYRLCVKHGADRLPSAA